MILSGIPAGSALSAGTFDPDTGSWTVDANSLPGLTLTPPEDYSGSFDITVSVTSTEGQPAADPADQSASVTRVMNVSITGEADGVTITPLSPAIGNEDTRVPLNCQRPLGIRMDRNRLS